MNDQKLEELIHDLESLNDEGNAYFGIQQYGGGPDESFVQGNREGLIRFAKELLKASTKTEEIDGKIIYLIDDENEWIDDMSEVGIDYIEKVDVSGDFLENSPSTNRDGMTGIGCIIAFVLIIMLVIIGVVTVFSWL